MKNDRPYKDIFFVKSVAKYYAIKISDIKWIYAKGNYCLFNLEGNEEYPVRTSLSAIQDYFNAVELIQINRNYLINFTKVKMYDPLGTLVIDNQELPVSKIYKNNLEEKLQLFK